MATGSSGAHRPSLLSISRGKASASSLATTTLASSSVRFPVHDQLEVSGIRSRSSSLRKGNSPAKDRHKGVNDCDSISTASSRKGKGKERATEDGDTASSREPTRGIRAESDDGDGVDDRRSRRSSVSSSSTSGPSSVSRSVRREALPDGDGGSILTKENASLSGDTGVEEEDDEEAVVVHSEDLRIDPRVMLRQQLLKRSESNVRNRSDTISSTYAQDSILKPPIDGEEKARSGDGGARGSYAPENTTSTTATMSDSVAVAVSRPRRYFVLTSAGKPVFASRTASHPSRSQDVDESEDELGSLVGVMQALVSLYAVDGDRIRYIDAGNEKVAFLLKSPIYLVVVSDWGEPESVLRTHLEYLYLQILSTVTHSQLHAIFARRSNYDLRRLLEGTEPFMHHLCEETLPWDLSVLTGSLHVLPLDYELRNECSKLLALPKAIEKSSGSTADSKADGKTGSASVKKESILYAILLAGTEIVTLLRPKTQSVHPADLHILLNMLKASKTLRTEANESWIPVCLPKFNSKGFVYAFISYFPDIEADEHSAASAAVQDAQEQANGIGDNSEEEMSRSKAKPQLELGVLLITADKEGFFAMQSWKDTIYERLHAIPSASSTSLLPSASSSRAVTSSLHTRLRAAYTPTLAIAELGIPALRHFLYKSRHLVQIATPTAPAFEGLYGSTPDSHDAEASSHQRRLISIYQHIHDSFHPSRLTARQPYKLVYLVTAHEAVLGLTTSTHELYVTLPSLVPKTVATQIAHGVSRWCRKNEDRLFLTTGPHF